MIPVRVDGPPPVVFQNGSWVTVAPWKLQVNGTRIEIPAGFHTDLASVPRLLWPLIGPHELGGVGPVLAHDWFYQSKGHGGVFTRMDADRIFYGLMRGAGVGRVKALVAWVGVRLGGGLIWRPDPDGWRDIVWRGVHTAWQTGIAVVLFDNPLAVIGVAVGLSYLKALLRFGVERVY